MRHQITYLITTIMIFAAFATSALKAQGIEGTWIQDGQYKKFSKEYKNIFYTEISNDSKKLAIVFDSVLKVIEIESGNLLDSILLPKQITTVANKRPSYAISKDFKYFSYQYNTRKEDNSGNKILEDLLIFDLENDSIKIDSVVTFDLSDITANGGYFTPSQSNAYFLNNAIYYSEFDFVYTKYADSHLGHKMIAFDCETKKELPYALPYFITKYFQSKVNKFSLVYSLDYSSNYYSATGAETVILINQDSIHIISDRGWYSSETTPPPAEKEYDFKGITADDKYAVALNSNNQILLYDLVGTESVKNITQANGNTKFPELASSTVLFPNDKAGKSILLLKPHGKNLLVNKLNYETGDIPLIASGDKDYITTSKACYMIDSNKILSITKAGELYLLDLEAIQPDKGIDICINKQFCTTNDSVSFAVINPNSYTDITIDFGDRTSVHSNKATHQYSQIGKYTVTVTAKDENGIEIKVIKDKYITVEQGIIINFKTNIEYLPNNKISITAQAIINGSYTQFNMRIFATGLDDYSSDTDNPESLTKEFTTLGYYSVRVFALDDRFNNFVIKDTILKAFGPENSNIIKEDYSKFRLYNYINLFKYNAGYVAFHNINSRTFVTLIDTNYKFIRQEINTLYQYFGNITQLNNSLYHFQSNSNDRIARGMFDLREFEPLNHLKSIASLSYFSFTDDVIGNIDSTNQEIVYQSITDSSVNIKINLNIRFENQPIVVHKRNDSKVYFIDTSAINGLTLYKLTNDSILTKINTIKTTFAPNNSLIKTIRTTQLNTFDMNDDNFIYTLNFNSASYTKIPIQYLTLRSVVRFSKEITAAICYDLENNIKICILNSQNIITKCIELPLRKGNILFAEKNINNQLDIVSQNLNGNLYFCTVKISDDTIPHSEVWNSDRTEILSYPNPTNISITIDNYISADAIVKIIDSRGNSMSASIISKSFVDFSIDTSLLPEGIYFLQIQDGEINKSVKFLVKR